MTSKGLKSVSSASIANRVKIHVYNQPTKKGCTQYFRIIIGENLAKKAKLKKGDRVLFAVDSNNRNRWVLKKLFSRNHGKTLSLYNVKKNHLMVQIKYSDSIMRRKLPLWETVAIVKTIADGKILIEVLEKKFK